MLDERLLDRIVDIYPDGYVIANGKTTGVYASRNFGKTWNKILSKGRITKTTRLSNECFVYLLTNVALQPERMLTYDTFKTNFRHTNTFWDDGFFSSSVIDSNKFYYARIEGGRCIIYTMDIRDYLDNIDIKYIDQFEVTISTLRHFNVCEENGLDIVAVTENSGNTTLIDINKEVVVKNINAGSAYVASDGKKLIYDLENNVHIKNCLKLSDVDRDVVNYFPTGSPILNVVRSGTDLYIFYDDINFTVIKYDTSNKRASLFFQLRQKGQLWYSGGVRLGVPIPTVPISHTECTSDHP